MVMLFFALIVGAAAGGTGVLFYHAMLLVTGTRTAHPWLLFLLPFGGLFIVFSYMICGEEDNKGTNLILMAIHNDEPVSIKVAPLIFFSTLITHLFGGSAGREGAALQIGGSIGGFIGGKFHFNNEKKHVFIMCGMSACFSAVFGTPLAAAIFSMEIVSVGLMSYSALVPCVIASFTASMIADIFHAPPDHFYFWGVPDFTFIPAAKIIVIALIFALASVVFCLMLHSSEKVYHRFLPNPYVRVFVGGLLVIGMAYLFNTRDYLGAGLPMIAKCFTGSIPWYAFLLKMIFTAVTLGAGFKGGEIVPSFFIGATLGCVVGPLFGLPSTLCAACGMVGLFCGVTNCPITSILMSFELFGTGGMPYYIITIAICYMMSGYYGLYSSQKIYFSKYVPRVVNRNAK